MMGSRVEEEKVVSFSRPAIPAEVAREILIEAGHRCAVCGAECPLERAHIIPWRECKEHTVDNLICLCANCHARADGNDWGQQALHEYKKRPWVLRHRSIEYSGPKDVKTRLQLRIDMQIDQFDERSRRFLQYAVAAFLETDPKDVEVIEVKEGSVKVTIDVPSFKVAKRLLRPGPSLREYLAPLPLLSVEVAAAEIEEARGVTARDDSDQPTLIEVNHEQGEEDSDSDELLRLLEVIENLSVEEAEASMQAVLSEKTAGKAKK